MLAELSARGFYFGVDTWLRLHRWLDLQTGKPEGEISTEKTRYALSAILCQTEEQQLIFQEVFDRHFKTTEQTPTPAEPAEPSSKKEEDIEPEPEIQPAQPAEPTAVPPLSSVASSRKGPIRIELRFPESELRAWNHEPMDRAMQPLREKEWTDTFDWDIPGSIRRTIQSGGIPRFVFQQRKKAPAYLVLIEQRSSRDHLSGFYREMVLELNRRDLDADYYFFDSSPHLVWKDRNSIHRRIPIERLAGEFSEARLLIIGPAAPLLALPDLRPSNLALDLREMWERMALLCSTPVPDWGLHEMALCQLFPVAPATAEGLFSLLPQWNTVQALTPHYWMLKHPEPALPNLKFRGRNVPPEIITNLRRYLGSGGFRWLCATAYYPELYFELTCLFNDEAIPPDTNYSEWEQNQVWWMALNRLCRLPWFRSGRLPNVFREALRSLLPEEDARKVREQILAVLSLPDNQAEPGSYAETGRAFTLAWLEAEQKGGKIEEFLPTEISLADVEDAVGRKIWQRQTMAPLPQPDGVFRILWATSPKKQWPRLEDQWNELMGTVSRSANSVSDAVAALKAEYFYLVITEPGFENLSGLTGAMNDAGLRPTLVLFDENQETKGPPPPGVGQVFRNAEFLQAYVGGMVEELTGAGASSYQSYGSTGPEQTAYQQGPEPESLARQGFMDLVKKAGSFSEAMQVLDDMKREDVSPDIHFFNALLSKTTNPEEIYIVLDRIRAEKLRPNATTFRIRAEKAASLNEAMKLFEEMRGEDIEMTDEMAASLLEKADNYEDARSVLSYLREAGSYRPSLEVYTILLKKTSQFEAAGEIFREMQSEGIRADKIAYTVYLSKAETYENARFIFDEMKREGIQTDPVVYTTMLDKTRDFYQASTIFEEMLKDGIKPNRGMFTQVMRRATKDSEADWVEEQMRNAGIGDGTIRRVRQQYEDNKPAEENFYQSSAYESNIPQEETATQQNDFDQIRNLITEGRLGDAFKKLSELAPDNNDLILQQARFREAEKSNRLGMISYADYSRQINQVNFAVLNIISELENRQHSSDRETSDKKRLKIYLSYSPKDGRMASQLQRRLQSLAGNYELDIWIDQELQAGRTWQEEIRKQLLEADLCLALLSEDYLYSKAYDDAVRALDERKTVVPIILRPCAWEETVFGRIQALPRGGQPISTQKDEEQAWTEVVRDLQRLIDTLDDRTFAA